MLLVPVWDGSEGDGVLRQLVDALLLVLGPLGPGDDVRAHMPTLRAAMDVAHEVSSLWEVRPPPPLQTPPVTPAAPVKRVATSLGTLFAA